MPKRHPGRQPAFAGADVVGVARIRPRAAGPHPTDAIIAPIHPGDGC